MTALLERPAQRRQQTMSRRKMTWEEYLALPEGPPYYEYEDGELVQMVRPHSRHQRVSLRLANALDDFVLRHQLGDVWQEIDVLFPGQLRGYIPDIVFLAAANRMLHNERNGKIHGVPDLVVEILSSSTRRRDRTQKMQVYQQAGVPWYWLIEQDDLTIEEFELTPRGYLANQLISPGTPFQPTLFPGLAIDLADLMGEVITDLENESEESFE